MAKTILIRLMLTLKTPVHLRKNPIPMSITATIQITSPTATAQGRVAKRPCPKPEGRTYEPQGYAFCGSVRSCGGRFVPVGTK